MDIDYTPLEEALKSGEFRKADDMTRALLITLAGDDAETREYVYFTEVKNIPVADLKTIDALWVAHSDGKFGYSVQRKLWKQKKEQWGKFFTLLDWTTGENNSYRRWVHTHTEHTQSTAAPSTRPTSRLVSPHTPLACQSARMRRGSPPQRCQASQESRRRERVQQSSAEASFKCSRCLSLERSETKPSVWGERRVAL